MNKKSSTVVNQQVGVFFIINISSGWFYVNKKAGKREESKIFGDSLPKKYLDKTGISDNNLIDGIIENPIKLILTN